jgi:hypothetical protein
MAVQQAVRQVSTALAGPVARIRHTHLLSACALGEKRDFAKRLGFIPVAVPIELRHPTTPNHPFRSAGDLTQSLRYSGGLGNGE